MISITNGKEKVELKRIQLHKRKKNYILFGKYNYWDTELDFVFENKIITKIQKCFMSCNGGGDVIKEYLNRTVSNKEILLNEDDYTEITRQISKFNMEDKFRKEAFVESSSQLLAYECYINYELEELDEVTIKNMFKEYICAYSAHPKEIESYKKEIFTRTKQILKEKYKTNLDYVFNGGSRK